VSNLVEILYHLDPDARHMSIEDYALQLDGTNMPAFKAKLTEHVQSTVKPIRQRYEDIIADRKLLIEVRHEGKARAKENSKKIMSTVKATVGLA